MKRRRRAARRGAVTLEFAVVAPLLFMFLFAAFEFSRANMVRHTADIAAYEGARRGMVPGATVDDVRACVREFLRNTHIKAESIEVSPSVISQETQYVTVDVSVPMDRNAWVTPRFLCGKKLNAKCTLARETP